PVVALELIGLDRRGRVEERDATAGDDALLEGGPRGLQRVLDAMLLLLHLGLGRSADLDHRNAAGELRQPLLQLLAVEVGVRVLDLGLELLDPCLDAVGRFVFSSLRPISSVITSAPERIAMSSSIRLRRSPKPGALTATAVNVPRSLLTMIVASDSPSTAAATISNGLPAWMTCSSTGRMSFMAPIFWLATRM